ncbi:UDP-N-acetylmuramoyl-L-alanyl-D-glutamate--2,6-diaminopimelate ligase [Salirhabdus sp. Marseille-P4669]|uniref:UDP-N-acetylmuramoyl-L-alanyl-D-glutamate--2, 6-diaminopimelate ligase n=1 Tax=Salirhabdus sp. Marseille-P4669 TaxID=2042310 RepID=UPI000C7970A4|nr:UDP-N-acetylmuramoyl-L-alanyl-D-glutamate--2,6-diaminopimelate ligase [Salirhabdus sp. Marseille-P4669]
MKLTELLSAIQFYKVTKTIEDCYVTGIEMDSRSVQEGNVFVCIRGFTVDGHDYAKDAERKGACAVVAEHPIHLDIPVIVVSDTSKVLAHLSNVYYQHPTQHLRLIGVTGTNGKTTLTYLLDEIFKCAKEKTGVIGTIQMKIGDEILPTKNTTPDALVLQNTFRKMVDQEVSTAVMEVSSHALDLGRVYGCEFDIAVFTNLSQDHLDYHDSMEDYFRAKSLLFSQLGNTYGNKPKYAVINVDDPYGEKLIKSTPYEVLRYGIHNKADVWAEEIELTPNGSSFLMKTPVGEIHVHTPLVGMFSIYNLMAATSAAICAGVPLSIIQQSFQTSKGVPGRFETVQGGQDFGVIVDYAHTPDSLENVLKTVQSFTKGDTYVVVGCGGDRDKSKRPKMANVAVNYSDYAIFTSDNPRTEDPNQILVDMTNGLTAENYIVEADRKAAIKYAIERAKKDDVILIAGKGHETYQEINRVRYNFDDREIASALIRDVLKGRSK